MTILCEPDAQTAEALLSALDDSVRTVSDLPAAALTISLGNAEDIVVLGSELPIDEVLSFAANLRAERPDMRVILLRDEIDDELLVRASEAGIDSVVSSGDNQQLTDAYYSARHGDSVAPELRPEFDGQPAPAPAPPPQVGRVVTLFSAKGGAGRTTIATNLAAALHAGGRKVCVIDLDVAFGDVAISLSLAPTRTIADAVEPSFRGTPEEHLNALITKYAEGFDAILAPVVPGDDQAVPVGLVQFVIRQMALRYDFVIIDTPARFSEHVLTALDLADIQLLVANPSIPALKNMRLTLDMLDILGYPPAARVMIVNEADDKLGVTDDQIASAVRGPAVASLPYSKDVAVAVNAGKPLVVSKPNHAYSQAVRRLADDVIAGGQAQQAQGRTGRRRNKARTTA